MKRFVSIWLPHLATDWFALRKPELTGQPFVLSAAVHGRMVITAASAAAEKLGISTGMVVADARVLCSSLQVMDEKPALVPQLLQRIAEWCIRFTPSAAVDAHGGILLDASGCAHLWGGDAAYITDMYNRLKKRGYKARIAIADTIGAAWAAARFSNELIIAEGGQTKALLCLPPEALRIDAASCSRLHTLGLHQVRDFISLPPSALRRRFGPLLIQRLRQAVGSEEELFEPLFAAEPYLERLPCPEPIVRIEGIEIALQRLLEQLCHRLRAEGKGVRTAYFRGYRTDGKTVGIQISTSRASHHVRHLFQLFQTRLSTIEPALGIELFLLEATSVEDHADTQEAFWKEAALDDSGLSELIDRLSARVGAAAIHRYLPTEHYWPERSFKKATSLAEQPTTDWTISRPRPLQLLPTPERIEVTAPVPDYPPMLFRYKGKLHKILKADGPERIEPEWWIAEGPHRDYFAVEDADGCRYWLFRAGHYDSDQETQWFLHGFFA